MGDSKILYLPTSRITSGIEGFIEWREEIKRLLSSVHSYELDMDFFDFDWVDAYKMKLDPIQTLTCAFEELDEFLKLDKNSSLIQKIQKQRKFEVQVVNLNNYSKDPNYNTWIKQLDFQLSLIGLKMEYLEVDLHYNWRIFWRKHYKKGNSPKVVADLIKKKIN